MLCLFTHNWHETGGSDAISQFSKIRVRSTQIAFKDA